MHPLPDPGTVQTQGLLWIGVVGTLAIAVISLIQSIKAAWKSDTNTLRVNGHSDSIQDLQSNQLPPALASDVLKAAATVNAAPAAAGDALADAKASLTAHADALKAEIAETPLNMVLSPTQQMKAKDLIAGIAAKSAQASAAPTVTDGADASVPVAEVRGQADAGGGATAPPSGPAAEPTYPAGEGA